LILQVVLVGESYQEAQAAAVARAVTEGLAFIPPYDDPYTIAGQGTIGDEIMRQVGQPCPAAGKELRAARQRRLTASPTHRCPTPTS
jgi:threonine dehydratase